VGGTRIALNGDKRSDKKKSREGKQILLTPHRTGRPSRRSVWFLLGRKGKGAKFGCLKRYAGRKRKKRTDVYF